MLENNQRANRLVKNTIVLYVRTFITLLIGLYTSRVILNSLGVVDFGLYNVVGGVVGFMSFINSSLAVSTIRFISYEQGNASSLDRLHLTFSTSRVVHWLLALIILILAETVGLWYVNNHIVAPEGRETAVAILYQFTIITCVLNIISVPYNALIVAHERMSAFAYISIFESVTKLFIAWIISVISFDRLVTYGLLMTLLYIASFGIYRIYCWKQFQETHGKILYDKKQIKEMANFSLWITNGTLAVAAYTQGLNLLLNSFFGPIVNAARGIAVQVQTAVFGFCSSFQSAAKPQVTKSYAEGDFGYLHKLVFNVSNYSFYLMFFLSLPIIAETPFILQLWLGEVPEYTVSFVRLTLIVSMLESLKMPLNTSIHATGNIKKFQLLEGTAMLMILPISYVCLKVGMSAISVFVVQAIIFFITQLIRCYIVCPAIRMSRLDYLKNCLMKILIVIIPPSVIVLLYKSFIHIDIDWLNFIVVGVISVISSALSVFFVGLDSSTRFKVISKFLSFIKK